jgi:hypothetical protein
MATGIGRSELSPYAAAGEAGAATNPSALDCVSINPEKGQVMDLELKN